LAKYFAHFLNQILLASAQLAENMLDAILLISSRCRPKAIAIAVGKRFRPTYI
jgi:hypothetical protein